MFSGAVHISRNSIRFKLVIGMLGIMSPLIILLIYNNFYAIKVVRNQVAESYRDMLSLYVTQIDYNLGEIDRYLSNIGALNTDLQIMNFSSDQSDYILSKMKLRSKIREDLALYKSVNSMFVYSASRRDFFEVENINIDYYSQQDVIDYITRICDDASNGGKPYSKKWYVNKIGGEYYLFRILKMDQCCIGALINVKNLIIPLNKIDLGKEGTSLLVTDDGKPMMKEDFVKENNIDLSMAFKKNNISEGKTKFLVVGEKSEQGDFGLIALVPDNKILEKLPYFRRVTEFISIGLILLLPVCLQYLRKGLLIPLKKLMSAMKRIQEGNLEVRIEPYPASNEFQIVNETFNNMISRIHDLKINVYEEKINTQKAELQHLHLQIKPHFFLNSLNIINILARSKEFELIQEMTQCLIQYFRFMFKSNLTFVPLKEELNHVKNYIRIQELRLGKLFTYKIEEPEFLMDIPIPPLIIQTFVENTIKYAVTPNDKVSMSVQIEIVDRKEHNPYLKIAVVDTGKGFDERVLSELVRGNRITDERGEHIGIWNVMRRLQFLYKDKASISFHNGNPSGAVVEILLPILENKLNTEASNG